MQIRLLHKWKALDRAFCDPQLNTMDAAVFFRLLFHHNSKTGLCFPSQELLAEALDRDPRTIRNSIRKLERAGYVRTQGQRRNGSSNSYLLNIGGPENSFQGTGKKFPEQRKKVSDDTRKEKEKEIGKAGEKGLVPEPRISLVSDGPGSTARTEASFEREIAKRLGGREAAWDCLMRLPAALVKRMTQKYLSGEATIEALLREMQ